MSQTSYAEQPAAFAGMLADATIVKHADTLVQGEASAEIPFGVAVALSTSPGTDGTPGKAVLPAAANAKIWGVAVHSHDYDNRTELGTTGMKPKVLLSALRKGRIWVTVETAVVAGDRAHIRYAAGAGGSQLGAFRNASVVNETIDLTKVAVFLTTASIGGLAMVEVDFTNIP